MAQTNIAALQTKTASISVLTDPNTNQPTVRFTNVNVQVISGTGATKGTPNERGNLIMRYNELRGSGGDSRTGSNNLVIGTFNNYISRGGVVFGYANSISGFEATVLGGESNTASVGRSSVTGGDNNRVIDIDACVIGGRYNRANSRSSSVIGGFQNIANGAFSTISGGQKITQNNDYGWSANGNGNNNGGAGTYHTP